MTVSGRLVKMMSRIRNHLLGTHFMEVQPFILRCLIMDQSFGTHGESGSLKSH